MALAKPGHLLASSHQFSHIAAPLAYAAPIAYAKLVPGAPLGYDGRVVDTPEVAYAKAEHSAAHINEKINLANEAVKSADYVSYAPAPAVVATSYASVPIAANAYHAVAPVAITKLVPGAPIGHDGRVVDTPEVAHAKAVHAAAHLNEKINHANEHSKSLYYAQPQVQQISAYSVESYAPQYYAAQQSVAPVVSVW